MVMGSSLAARMAVATVALSLAAAVSSTAFASDLVDYEPYVPNGTVNTCITCHLDITGIDLNDFGWTIQNSKGAVPEVPPDWSLLCADDSDLDGQTNGQELGDPCCEWQVGQPAPRTTAISNPGDAASTSADPDGPGCSAEDDDGCSVTGGPVDGPAGLAAALVALVLGVGILRRRQAF